MLRQQQRQIKDIPCMRMRGIAYNQRLLEEALTVALCICILCFCEVSLSPVAVSVAFPFRSRLAWPPAGPDPRG
jgi:hypothetical protein